VGTVHLVKIQLPNPVKLHLHITGWIMLDLPVAIFWEIATMDLLWLLHPQTCTKYDLLIPNASEKSSWVSQMKILYSAIWVHISTIATHWSTPNTCWVELIRKIGTAWANSTSPPTSHLTYDPSANTPNDRKLGNQHWPTALPKVIQPIDMFLSSLPPKKELYTFLNQHLQRGAN